MRSGKPFLIGAVLVGSCTSLAYTRAGAIAAAGQAAHRGDDAATAMGRLHRHGFRCRQLAPNEYASFDPAVVRMVRCHTEADRSAEGYTLVYASLGIDRRGRVTEVHADHYPVLYHTLRRDAQGRVIVVSDDK